MGVNKEYFSNPTRKDAKVHMHWNTISINSNRKSFLPNVQRNANWAQFSLEEGKKEMRTEKLDLRLFLFFRDVGISPNYSAVLGLLPQDHVHESYLSVLKDRCCKPHTSFTAVSCVKGDFCKKSQRPFGAVMQVL